MVTLFIWTLVVGLLFYACPPDVAWFVVAVFIGVAIQTVAVWAFSNVAKYVGKEDFKVVPTSANFYTERAVIFVTVCVWVGAAAVHAVEGSVQGMKVTFSGMTVRQVADLAAAGLSTAFQKTSTGCEFCVTAVAFTLPQYVASAISVNGWVDCSQSTKAPARDIAGWATNSFEHRAAPAVRMKWRVSVLPTLTSLRSIAEV